MDRRLAAILAADVVGYSKLMERDEQGTYERLVAGRKELFEPEIARHHGRIFKLMGDGLLAEFSSVVDAVECAVALQQGLRSGRGDGRQLAEQGDGKPTPCPQKVPSDAKTHLSNINPIQNVDQLVAPSPSSKALKPRNSVQQSKVKL